VIGGINVRGVIIPVLDLRIAFGRSAPPLAHAGVILMVHDGRILGLLVESVTGVFFQAPAGINRIVVDDPIAAIFSGSVQNAEDGALVSILSSQAIAGIPGLPMVCDPEPQRQPGTFDAEKPDVGHDATPLMLVRCGRSALAVEAMAVHTTLSNPKVEHSPLAGGHWRGIIEYSGFRIPAVDFAGFCGLDALSPGCTPHAFIIRLAAGMVAFLVEEVVDVVRGRLEDVVAVPGFALARRELFRGALPARSLPPELGRRDAHRAPHYLVLDKTALFTHDEVVALSAINTGVASGHRPPGEFTPPAASRPAAPRRMIIYASGRDLATPLEQLVEILPYSPDLTERDDGNPLVGILINRGRTIPVLCLAQLATGAREQRTREASVLVVESDGELVGFAVTGLKSIGQAHWEPELPATGVRPADALSQAVHSLSRALCVDADGERMLPVLDLRRIATLARETSIG
jgi:purine-binding chemotaxis protein CheW